MIPRRLHRDTMSSMLGMSCGGGDDSFVSSVAAVDVSSVAADDRVWLAPRDATRDARFPWKAKVFANFCPQRNMVIACVAIESFMEFVFLLGNLP